MIIFLNFLEYKLYLRICVLWLTSRKSRSSRLRIIGIISNYWSIISKNSKKPMNDSNMRRPNLGDKQPILKLINHIKYIRWAILWRLFLGGWREWGLFFKMFLEWRILIMKDKSIGSNLWKLYLVSEPTLTNPYFLSFSMKSTHPPIISFLRINLSNFQLPMEAAQTASKLINLKRQLKANLAIWSRKSMGLLILSWISSLNLFPFMIFKRS